MSPDEMKEKIVETLWHSYQERIPPELRKPLDQCSALCRKTATDDAAAVLSSIEEAGCVIVPKKHWEAVQAALASYQYGNSSTELAASVLKAVSSSPYIREDR